MHGHDHDNDSRYAAGRSPRDAGASARLLRRLDLRLVCGWTLLCLAACSRPSPEASPDSLVVLLPREPQALDPRHVGEAQGLRVSRLLHAGLVSIDPQTLEVVPELAASIEVVSPTRVRAVLRDGLRFADGSPLGVQDVVATFQALADPGVGSRYARTYARIERVVAQGDRAILFELGAPHATILTDLEFPVLRRDQAFDPRPRADLVGAGPYRLAARRAGELQLVANPHWHRGRAARPSLRLMIVHDDNTRALRLLAGGADLALNAVPPMLLPMFEQSGEFRVESKPGVGTTYLGFNLEDPAVGDLRVRRAVGQAIDRALIIETKLAARARIANGWIVPGHWAHADALPVLAHDPAAARRELDAAGLVPDAQGVRARLSLRTGADRFIQSIARAMCAMLREVGLVVDMRPSETATLLADLKKGRFQIALLSVPEVLEPHVLSWFFASHRIPGQGGEGANRWRLRSAALDEALERGRVTLDRPGRRRAYVRAQQILAQQLPVLPLWHEDVVAVFGRRVGRFHVPRDGRLGNLAVSEGAGAVSPPPGPTR